ncbi:hypothetical protein V8C35DRAFT_279673 [Trichoderma chlorosporum]
MRIHLLLGLLLGLIYVTNGEPNLDIWEIDETCKPHRPVLQKAYNDVAVMVSKALQDIQFVQQPRPQRNTRSNKRMEWDRIARAVKNMFGFEPDEQGTDSKNQYMVRILEIFQNMTEAIHGNHNLPEGGFTKRHEKALWLCDDKPWVWYHSGKADPNDPALRPLFESRKDIMKSQKGVWIYKDRYITNNDDHSVHICEPDTHARTQVAYDMITFCPTSFTGNVAKAISPVDGRNGVTAGKELDDFGRFSLSRIMFHELVHWYGSKDLTEDGLFNDQQAVSNTGELAWVQRNGNGYKLLAAPRQPDESWSPLATYYFGWVARLARSHEGELAQNSGPDKATKTPEAYAYFAMMSYVLYLQLHILRIVKDSKGLTKDFF